MLIKMTIINNGRSNDRPSDRTYHRLSVIDSDRTLSLSWTMTSVSINRE